MVSRASHGVNGLSIFSHQRKNPRRFIGRRKCLRLLEALEPRLLFSSIHPAAADTLVFTQETTSTSAGAVIAPAVELEIEDSNSNVITSDDSPITLALTGTSGGSLGGTLVVTA